MSDEEQKPEANDPMPLIRRLMELVLVSLELSTAMRLALEDAGVLTPQLKASAMARAKAIWYPRRQEISKVGTTEEEILRQLLEDFEGTKQ